MDMENQNQNTQNQQPLNPELAGYPTVDALVAGYRNSSEEGKRQRERADKLEQLVTQQLMANAENQRRAVPNRTKRPEEQLTDYGVPVDALDAYLERKIGEKFEPIVRGVQARGSMLSKNPGYLQFENDVAQFIETEPDFKNTYNNMFNADPAGAMEYAFLKFADSRRGALPASANGGSREGIGDASIPSSRAGDGRRAPDQDSAIQSAFERWQKTGSSADAAAYAKARLHNVITDDFLNQ
jgi:hypothetical protein